MITVAKDLIQPNQAFEKGIMNGVEVDNEWEDSQYDYSKSKRKKYGIIAAIVLGVAAIAAGVFLAVTSVKTEDEIEGNTIGIDGVPGTGGVPGPNAPIIRQIIFENARKGGREFDDSNSYQSRALDWVLTQHIPFSEFPDMDQNEQALQLYSLACLFFATYAADSDWTIHHYGEDVALPGWFDHKGWVNDGSDVCDWYGLTCNLRGQVVKIELDTNGLTGSIPPELAYLKESLEYIDFFSNIVHNKGDEGNSFLGELTNLKYLYYGQTSFQYDGIPTEIGLLTNLKEYDFSYTLYFGKLDGSIFENLSNLNYLVMTGNSFNSTLPEQIIKLPELEYLYAGNSFLEGDLNFVSRMPKIYELWLDQNSGIRGSIPSSISDATALASLSATGCSLTGSLPSEISKMSDLIQLWFYDNQLTGTIPAEYGQLNKLKILGLQKNEITGTMPDEICQTRRPFGRLEVLETDCDDKVECSDICCTCCGEQCINLRRDRSKL
jgi:hypothetical protein